MNEQNPNNQLNGQNSQSQPETANVLGNVVGPAPVVNPTPSEPSTEPSTNTVGTPQVPNAAPQQPVETVSPAASAPQTPAQPVQSTPDVASTTATPDVASTGGVQATPAPTDAVANQQAATPVSNNPIAQPIPGTSGTPYQANSLTGETVGVGSSNMGQDNLNTNGFAEPIKVESIGSIPPENTMPADSGKAKKPLNKVVFVIIIVVLIAAVAFGVYYFLSVSSGPEVSLKSVTIGVGESLSDNIADYADISGDTDNTCVLNTRNVDTSTIGEYSFTITCGDDVYTGTLRVSDVSAPVVTLKTVYKEINSTVEINDFVESCNDASDCALSFVDESALSNYLSTAGGPYDVEINVSDSVGNETVVVAQLYVTPYAITIYRNCSSASEEVTGYQATKTVSDYLPYGNNGTELVYLGVSQRIYTYVFTDSDEYYSVVGDKEITIDFDGISGYASYSDEDLTFQIKTDLSLDTLNQEAEGSFPTSYVSAVTYYLSLGYTCSNL